MWINSYNLLDAEKAFDNINWDYMIQNLKATDCGKVFINMIEAIYKKQDARIVINADMTDKIDICKGTRQGCPLSPLLFIFSIEGLCEAIKSDNRIQGIKIKGQEYKIQAYADDIAITLLQGSFRRKRARGTH